MRKRLITLSLAGVILLAGAPAVAAQEPTDGGGQTSSSGQNDEGFPWGLLGLLGLAGLAGMNRRRDDRDRTIERR